MPSKEPETIYASELGKTKDEQLGETNKCGDQSVEYIPRDCGYGNSEPGTLVSEGDAVVVLSQELGEELSEERKLSGAKLGPGGLGSGGMMDMKMVGRAIRERWPIPDHIRQGAAKWMADVAQNAKDRRARVNAVKVLAELDKLNMAQEQADAGGPKLNLDVTSGGKPLQATEYAKLSTEQLEELLKQREIGGTRVGD